MKILSFSRYSVLPALVLFLLSIQAGVYPQGAGIVDLPGLDKLPVIKELPDPFLLNNGRRVSNQADWAKRREELRAMVLYYEYGHLAPAPTNLIGTEHLCKKSRAVERHREAVAAINGPRQKSRVSSDSHHSRW